MSEREQRRQIEAEHAEMERELREEAHAEEPRERRKHKSEASGALMGTVAVGPLGAPIGAAVGRALEAVTPDPNEPPSHTHEADAPCYDGCPAWTSRK